MQVSVIIPTYNRVDRLSRTVLSVLAQTHFLAHDFEVIVIDDGSTDNTVPMLKNAFPQVRVIQQANEGVSKARNVGIKAARYPWIAFLDSDDQWLENKIALQCEKLHKTKYFICHTNELWYRNGKPLSQLKKHQKKGGWIFQHCLPMCLISPSAVILHKNVLHDVGFFDELLPVCEDYDLWLRICAKYPIAFVDKPLLIKQGGHDDQLSRQYWGMDRFRVQALEKILQTTLTDDDYHAAHTMFFKKLRILSLGAQKHDNQKIIAWCAQKQKLWAHQL